ncbi:hypothetical protein D3C73_1007850 [compost metagenome]
MENGSSEGEEGELRERYIALTREALDAATDPDSADLLNFHQGFQPVVDAAFLAHGILRAPTELCEKLEPRVKKNVAAALVATRTCKPHFNNWLLFSAIVEAALCKLGESWDVMRVDYALKQHEQWYLGDGVYGDGHEFHWDYYNSFVIQPMLIDILETVGESYPEWSAMKEKILKRAIRFADIQERQISPEGTFPVVGRSIAYRFGAFQHLAQMALRQQLPNDVEPAQVRCALTAVIKRMIEMPGTFDQQGWLRIGFCGEQTDVGESYISTGSLYLCSTVFLPLGLPEAAPFWHGKADWTSKKAWSGQPFIMDEAFRTPRN